MLDHRVGSGVDEPGVAVLELHQVGRLSHGAAHLDDLAVLVRVPDNVAVYTDMVANGRLHVRISSPRRELCLQARTSKRRCTPGPPVMTRCDRPRPKEARRTPPPRRRRTR